MTSFLLPFVDDYGEQVYPYKLNYDSYMSRYYYWKE